MGAEAVAPDGSTPPAPNTDSPPTRPDHHLFFHWLPWVLPLAAIALPEVILIIVGTGVAGRMSVTFAARAVSRGDLLIPVIIVCAEAFRRWWETRFGSAWLAAVAGFLAVLSLTAALIAIAAYAIVLANPDTRGYADIADTFTWGPLVCGFVAGTIAVGQSASRKAARS